MPGTPDVPAYAQEHFVSLLLAPIAVDAEGSQTEEPTASVDKADPSADPLQLANDQLQRIFDYESLLVRISLLAQWQAKREANVVYPWRRRGVCHLIVHCH